MKFNKLFVTDDKDMIPLNCDVNTTIITKLEVIKLLDVYSEKCFKKLKIQNNLFDLVKEKDIQIQKFDLVLYCDFEKNEFYKMELFPKNCLNIENFGKPLTEKIKRCDFDVNNLPLPISLNVDEKTVGELLIPLIPTQKTSKFIKPVMKITNILDVLKSYYVEKEVEVYKIEIYKKCGCTFDCDYCEKYKNRKELVRREYRIEMIKDNFYEYEQKSLGYFKVLNVTNEYTDETCSWDFYLICSNDKDVIKVLIQ